jgi:hypothetical protein
MPSPVYLKSVLSWMLTYQWRKAFRLNSDLNCACDLLKTSLIAVVLATSVAAAVWPLGGTVQRVVREELGI